MSLIRLKIIAPDSSHWANWIDSAQHADPYRRETGRSLHQKLLEQGKIPLLSWHHLQELLSIENDARARSRIAFLQSLPLIAWMGFPNEQGGVGAITDILAAEAIAVDAGCNSLTTVRDYVRHLLLRTGPGSAAIGPESWVWEAVRPEILSKNARSDMIAALAGYSPLDERQTIAQLTAHQICNQGEIAANLVQIHKQVTREVMAADRNRTPAQARVMADAFLSDVLAMMPSQDISVRELVVSTFVKKGIDPEEITDECRLSDLSELATFRTRLKIVAGKTGLSFERLNKVRMENLPSWRITRALREHGQHRAERPGSNLADSYLAVLAAYTDILYVDRRTHEDFRRVLQKEPAIAQVVGAVAKAARYSDIC